MKVIAESAFNHNGSLSYLKELALSAKNQKTDYFTIQVMHVPSFCVSNYSKYKIYEENSLKFEEWIEFFNYSHKINLSIIPCVLDIPSLELCYDNGFRFFKIHATDITNISLINRISELDGIKLILETQCATNIEIDFALGKLQNCVVCLMHGFSNYPTEIEDLNLNTLDYFKTYYPEYKIGFADHSLDIDKIPLMALSKGCSYFEKHITLTRNNRNFDYQVSLYPHEFGAMISILKQYKKALGVTMKHPVSSEKKYRSIMYKKIIGNDFKRSDSGTDYMTHIIESFDIKKVGVALIARLKSKRLPQKVLKPFHDTILIDFLYKRLVNNSKYLNSVYLATSFLPDDKYLAEIGKNNNFKVYLGHPISVIDRMLGLALQEQLGAIFRVTGDNPFTDVELIDEMIQLMWENKLDYVRSNNAPFGVSAELFSVKYLWDLYLNMENPMQSEYLTQFVLEDESAKKGCIDIESELKNIEYINLSIDFQEDLDRAYSLINQFNGQDIYKLSLKDIVKKIDTLERESKAKVIKLADGEEVSFSVFLEKLKNQSYIIRKKLKL
jgi:sialic acid synthase SpsE/spore coat polysaccharide biosynthesis protein SpsF (cytidylyltransferase family)